MQDGTDKFPLDSHCTTTSTSPTDMAVIKYLNKKGYRHAEELIPSASSIENVSMELCGEQDAQVVTSSLSGGTLTHIPPISTSPTTTATSPPNGGNSTVPLSQSTISISNNGNGSAAAAAAVHAYEVQFLRMKKWILNSLEIYRIELVSLIFPILVHCYLDLHSRALSNEATLFLSTQRKDSVLSSAEEDDIDRLLAVKDVVHLRENSLVLAFRSHKFNVKLSLYAFELFVTFVNEHRLTLIRKIVNAHINLIVTEGSLFVSNPVTASAPVGSSGLASYAGTPVAEPGRRFVPPVLPRVWWGVPPPDESILRVHSSNVPEHAAPITLSHNDESDPSIKENPLFRHAEPDTSVLLSRLKELSRRVLIGRHLLPSSVCYTFHNSYGRISLIRFSIDGVLMATGSYDSYIDIWSTGRGLPSSKPPCFVLSATKKSSDLSHFDLDSMPTLAEIKESSSPDETCWCGGIDGQHCISRRLIGHSGPITGFSFSFDRRFLVSSSVDGTVRLWSLDTFSTLVLFRGHAGPVWDVSMSRTSTCNTPLYFASGGADKTIRIWSSEWLSPIRLLVGHLGDVDCVTFHSNGLYVASGSSDRTIRLWDIQTGSTVRLLTLGLMPISISTPTTLSFSPCGKYIAGGDTIGRIYLWDISTGRCIFETGNDEKEKTSVSYPISSLAWSMVEGKILASGSLNGTIALWEFTIKNDPDSPPTSASISSSIQPIDNESASSGNNTTSSTQHTFPLSLLKTFYTKNTPVLELDFSARNLLLVGGIYSAPSTAL